MKQLLLAIGLLLFCLPTVQADELEPLLGRLKAAAAGTGSLESRFVQEKHLAIFSEKLRSEGRFAYRKPDQLRWELTSPFASGFVLRGDKGERWNGLSGERDRFSAAKDPIMGMVAKQLLAWARVDLDWLQQRYRIELLASEPLRLRLTPVDAGEAGFIKHLVISFASDLRYIATVQLYEQGGDSTLFAFNDVQLNGDLPEELFQAPEF